MLKKILLVSLLTTGISGLVAACTPPNEKDSDISGTTPATISGDQANPSKLAK